MHRLLHHLFLLGISLISCDQAFSLSPSQWRKPKITTLPEQRISLASGALEEARKIFNSTSGQFNDDGNYNYPHSGNFYGQMANFDLATNGTQFKDVLMTYFPKGEALRPGFLDEFLDYGMIYGLAAVQAYSAYHERAFLDFAERSWVSIRAYSLSQDDVKAGHSPVKSVSIMKDWGGASLAGGTFWKTDKDDNSLNGLSTGSFLILSALLAEATGNQTYFEAASESLNFLLSHLYTNQYLVQDNIASDTSMILVADMFPYNSVLMIEGMAILASISQNASIMGLLHNSLMATINNPAWHNNDGIISTQDDKHWYIVRALSTVYQRNATDPDLHTQIRDYLGIQYNALLDLGRAPGSNIYGRSWIGPAGAGLMVDPSNQVNALSVLISAISLQNETNTTNTDPTSSPPAKLSSTEVGAIGGAIGGTALLVGAGIGFWFLLRRHRYHHRKNELPSPYPVGTTDPKSRMDKIFHPPNQTKRQMRTEHQYAEPAQLSNPDSTEMAGRAQSELSTECLFRLLNSRLEAGGWEENEMPPDYTSESPELARDATNTGRPGVEV